MIIAVASGKGGTGKTTVAVNLALSLVHDDADMHVSFLDCDVEEPNAALFIDPVFETQSVVEQMVPQVDLDRCTFCGRCSEVCRYHAIAVVPPKVLVFGEMCHGCGSCTLNCPVGAIQEIPRPMGLVECGRAGEIAFAQGTMDIGEAMAVPVIRHLKKRMVRDQDHGNRFVILDAPPGTACPVVETMRGTDAVLMVTEPTPFGLHDLRMAVEVARDELGLPVGVVINRDGVGDSGVEAYCAEEGIPILMRIPLDRRIAEAYSEGVLLIKALPEYRERFLELYTQIVANLRFAGKGDS